MLTHCALKTHARTSWTKSRCPIWKLRSAFFTFKLEVERWKLIFTAKYFWWKPVPQLIVRQIYCSITLHFSKVKIINRKNERQKDEKWLIFCEMHLQPNVTIFHIFHKVSTLRIQRKSAPEAPVTLFGTSFFSVPVDAHNENKESFEINIDSTTVL